MRKKVEIIDYTLLIIIFALVIIFGGRCEKPVEVIPESFSYGNFREYVKFDIEYLQIPPEEIQKAYYIENISNYVLANITANISTDEGEKTFFIKRLEVGERQILLSLDILSQGYNPSYFRAKGDVVNEK